MVALADYSSEEKAKRLEVISGRIARLGRSKSAQNSLWIIGERIISAGIATIITIISARYLGVENYGVLTYGLSLVTLFAGVMKLGLDYVMVDELINHKDKQGSFLGTSIVLRLVSSVLSIVAIFIILSIMNAGQWLIITVALIQAIVLIFQAFYVLDFWFQSELKSKFVSIAKASASVTVALYSGYLLLAGKNVAWFAVSTTLSGLVVGLVLFAFFVKQSKIRISFSFADAKYLLSKSHHFMAAGIISTIYIQIDRVMIGNMLDQEKLGLYSAALVLCTAWVFLPTAIITSVRPSIVIAKKRSNRLYLRQLKRLYFAIFWLSTLIAGVISIIAPVIIPLFFGHEFRDSVLVAQIAIWYVPFSMLGTARNIWNVSEGKHRYPKMYLIHGLILNVSLNLILIPYWGILGAAVSTVATELLTCFISPLFYKETRIHTRIVLEAIIYKLGVPGKS